MAKVQTDQQEGKVKGEEKKEEKVEGDGKTGGEKGEGKGKRGESEGGGKPKRQRSEGLKVKQVTFQEPEKEESKGPKKVRKRIKRILQQLRHQMDFYFGDSNLSKDRYMKEQIEQDPGGYVPLSTFMTFGKIKELATSQDMLVKAIKFSSMLQVSEDGSKVRRMTPVKYLTDKETDIRTIYVEGFHKYISREWIEREFSKCGRVTYISLPRYKTTQEIKGYAFVEYETPEQAETAVKMLNCVPDEFDEKPEEKVAGSIKQSKNLTYWKRRASKEGLNPEELEAALKECKEEDSTKDGTKDGTRTKPRKKKRKNRLSVNQGEGTGADTTTAPKPDSSSSVTEESKENAVKPEAPNETDDTKTKKSKKSKKKRRRRSSVSKMAFEDGAGQGVGKTESSAPKLEKSNTAEAEVPKDCKESSEESYKVPRKRVMSAREDSPSSAKVPRVKFDPAPGGEGEQQGGKEAAQYKCTSAEDSKKVWEICDAAPPSGSVGGEDSASQKVGGRKRKARDSEDSVQQTGQSTASQNKQITSEGDKTETQERTSKKRKADPEDTLEEKPAKIRKESQDDRPAKVKKESRHEEKMQRHSEPPRETGRGEGRKRPRRGMEGEEEGSGQKKKKPGAGGSGSEVVSEDEASKKKKKRHRRNKAPEPVIRLRVMTKDTWVHLKKDYLQQQKLSLRKLKDQLQEASRQRREKAQNKLSSTSPQGEEAGRRPPPEFVPNVILEVKSEAELCLQTIKADIPQKVEVSYVDIRPGMTEGYIRCKDTESASKLLTTGLRGLSLSLMTGEPELQYWNKLISDRQSKRQTDGKRKKRRGKLKILQRAQNPQEESERQHLIFSEDGTEEVIDRSENPEHNRDDFNAYSHRQRPPVW